MCLLHFIMFITIYYTLCLLHFIMFITLCITQCITLL